jgi:hypothetical protein
MSCEKSPAFEVLTCERCGSSEYMSGSACVSCNPGFSAPSLGTIGSDAAACTRCAPGYSGTSVGGVNGCIECATGFYKPLAGNAECTACATGLFRNDHWGRVSSCGVHDVRCWLGRHSQQRRYEWMHALPSR